MKEEKTFIEGTRDNRPVRCFVCKRKLYYAEHPKWEPEITIDDFPKYYYIHKKCLMNVTAFRKLKRALLIIK